MTFSDNTRGYFVLRDYIDSLWHQQPDRFSSLLSKVVKLVHYTNGLKDYEVEGVDSIMELFRSKFFDKLVLMDAHSIEFINNGKTPEYKLTSVQEMMHENTTVSVKYYDHSSFQLAVEQDGVLRITEIVMKVSKEILTSVKH